eukprot:CAMPEP_0198501732 /NCGR_PEP_ID=MMETSP1462-20131121/8884_1 /TAXON_ID=1333877 /ORGANISM="Brandtodinium nutriculum, Strain RCC3387" /LENGTH=408 /DNA_ID=CAMNT_0044230787 /DNA_START=57 /DNA_END=1280 /DNA_ORIENTATION=+
MKLCLPIEARKPEATDAGRGEAGRMLFTEAFATGMSSPDDSGMRVTVRNTFIDVKCEEEDVSATSSMHDRGAQTCSARFSESTPASLNILEGKTNGPLDDVAEEPSHIRSEINDLSSVPVEGSAVDAANRSDGSPAGRPEESTTSPGGTQRPPAVPPPAYAAPATFEEHPTSPPPARDPGVTASVGLQVLDWALGRLTYSPTGQPEDDTKFRIKNTFIEVEDEPANDRGARSCTAALMSPAPSFLLSPQATAAGRSPVPAAPPAIRVVKIVQQPVLPAAAPRTAGAVAPPIRVTVVPAAPLLPGGGPSPGSAQHGEVDADGQPLCQPCAWFYKASGCQNGANCRRCHLCTEGELKIRKKLKIARMRDKEGTPGGGGSPTPTGTPSPGGKAPTSMMMAMESTVSMTSPN